MKKGFVVTSRELEILIKEVEVLKELDGEYVVWFEDGDEDYQKVKRIKKKDVYEEKEEAINSVIEMYNKKIFSLAEDKEEWENKL
ncbi:MAG: hypothetical protein ACOC5T_07315 [Elusimicrobiota bacterium]